MENKEYKKTEKPKTKRTRGQKSPQIEEYIEKLTEKAGGTIKIKRKELAERLSCYPSHISYVLKELSDDNKYTIKSHQGANGYLEITKKVNQNHIKIPSDKRQRQIKTIMKREVAPFLDNMQYINMLNDESKQVVSDLIKLILIMGGKELDIELIELIKKKISRVRQRTFEETFKKESAKEETKKE